MKRFIVTHLQTNDKYIETILKTKFYNDEHKFIEAVKKLFQKDDEFKTREYNLLKAYQEGELSIGQIAKYLNISKSETMELLKRYEIPFIELDEEYLKHEFDAFN